MKDDDADKVRFVTVLSDNVVANTASVLSEVFAAPTTTTIVSTGVGHAAGGPTAVGRGDASISAGVGHAGSATISSSSSVRVDADVVKAQPPSAQPRRGARPRPPRGRQPPGGGGGGPPSEPVHHAALHEPRKFFLQPEFKLVFITVAALTILASIAHISLAFLIPMPTPNQQTVFNVMGSAWQAGFGALIGLLGGKVI